MKRDESSTRPLSDSIFFGNWRIASIKRKENTSVDRFLFYKGLNGSGTLTKRTAPLLFQSLLHGSVVQNRIEKNRV
ncbi:hypothetical protein DLM78_18190 [Leptospira stimsonii]|uniref:Uncharacterized protein n=1 Tax=Leptospira stimsonii TaxID=2202203 RepID=A0A8B3CMV3_9LEPT|nr:hypothetical protein DLM78_18190 [Leptospira stimsonii]